MKRDMTKHEKELDNAVGIVCHECCNRGFDYDGYDCVCSACNVSRIYDILLENIKGREEL